MRIGRLFAILLNLSLFRTTVSGVKHHLCAWTKVMPGGETHHTFLRSDRQQPHRSSSPAARLYHSVWSGDGGAVKCAWSDDASVVQNYLSTCQRRANEFSEIHGRDLDVDSLFAANGSCVRRTRGRQKRSVIPAGSHAGPGTVSHLRVKRGFIVPGTLWCGSGNKAPSYADLGVFAETDSCCREHDQCQHTILSFQTKFGVFNRGIFTMSHCSCDYKFRSCLANAEDRISDVVAYTFFNLLKMNCFEFSHQLQCTERNWFGMCKVSEVALYAVVHPPTTYESVSPEENDWINTTMNYNQTLNFSETQEDVTSVPPQVSVIEAALATPSSIPDSNITFPAHANSTGIDNLLTYTDKPRLWNGPTRFQQDATNASQQLSCDVYKDLDECSSKILPGQTKYGLHNPETRTLYHCNCTNRLFGNLAMQRELMHIQRVLLEYVSQSCFSEQDCRVGTICKAVEVKAAMPLLPERRNGRGVGKQRPLQALRSKARRPRRKDRVVRLYKLCHRITARRLRRPGSP